MRNAAQDGPANGSPSATPATMTSAAQDVSADTPWSAASASMRYAAQDLSADSPHTLKTDVSADSPRTLNTDSSPSIQKSLRSVNTEDATKSWGLLVRMASFARKDEDFIQEQVAKDVIESWDDSDEDLLKPSPSSSTIPDVRVAVAYWKKQRRLLKTAAPDVVDTESRFDAWLEHSEMQRLLHEVTFAKEMRYWFRFDMFFGVVVCINGCSLGLTTAKVFNDSDLIALDIVCLVLFTVEWCFRWYHHIHGFKGMLLDSWTRFDLVVLLITYVDTLVTFTQGSAGGMSVMPALRTFRLMRMIRMLRLVRLFDALWKIVSTLTAALRTLFWSLLMFWTVCYIFGLLFYSLLKEFSVLETTRDILLWGSVGRCMLTLAEIASYSGVDEVHGLIDDHLGLWAVVAFISFLCIASVGLYNLAVAVLMTFTLRMASQEENFESSTKRLLEHKALYELRLALLKQCLATLGESGFSSPFVTREFLCDCCEGVANDGCDSSPDSSPDSPPDSPPDSSPVFRSQLTSSSIMKDLASRVPRWLAHRTNTLEGLPSYFEAASVDVDLIHCIFNEAESALNAVPMMTLDDFIECCSHRVHPLDVHLHHSAYRSFMARLSDVEDFMLTATLTLQELSQHIKDILCKYQGVKHDDTFVGPLDLDKQVASDPDVKHTKDVLLKEQEQLIANELKKKAEALAVWNSFDYVFSAVVMLNAILIGAESMQTGPIARDFTSQDFDLASLAWFVVDQFFCAIYVFELVMRFVLHFQIEYYSDYRVWRCIVPRIAWGMDLQMKLNCLRQIPKHVKNLRNMLAFDIAMVSIALLDNFAFRFVAQEDAKGDTMRFAELVRVAGLFRLIRLARLLHLVRPLAVLVTAFADNMKLTMWSVLMLMTVLYTASVISVMSLQTSEGEEVADQQSWGHVWGGMLSWAQIATCSNWGQQIDELADLGFGFALLGWAVFGIAYLGILNLVSGVMVQAAYNVVVKNKEKALLDAVDSAKPEVEKMLASGMGRMDKRLHKEEGRVRDQIQSARRAVQEHVRMCKASEQAVKKAFGMDEGAPTISASWRSFQSILTGRHESKCGEDNQEHASSFGLQSKYDAEIYCTIVHATWCSHDAVAVGFHLRQDALAPKSVCDPMLSALMWEGARITPRIFLEEGSLIGGQEQQTAAEADEGKTELKGDLLFTNVPNRVKLRFQFGGNYSAVPLSMDCPPALMKKINANMDDLAPMTKGEIGARDLVDILLQEKFLKQRLAGVGLRPEHTMLAFHSIDVANRGRINADSFLNGLFRLRRPNPGLDMAAAKTLSRKLNGDLKLICEQTQNESDCLSFVVQRLRRVSRLEVVDFQGNEPIEDADLGVDLDPELFCRREIKRLQMRVMRLRAHILRWKVISGDHDHVGLEVPPSSAINEDSTENGSTYSVKSANLGWD